MSKAAKALCGRCNHRIGFGQPSCGSCGYPSVWATHDERVAWEVAQYRDKTMNLPMGVLYEPKKPTVVIGRAKPTRRIGLFARKSHAPKLLMAEPKRGESEPILKSVPSQSEPVAAPAPKPAAKSASRVKPRASDKKAASDTPATVLAMRLLNQRVAELDAKVQELQRQIVSMTEAPRSGYGN